MHTNMSPSSHVKCQHGGAHLKSQCQSSRGRRILETYWPASLPSRSPLISVRKPVSEKQDGEGWRDGSHLLVTPTPRGPNALFNPPKTPTAPTTYIHTDIQPTWHIQRGTQHTWNMHTRRNTTLVVHIQRETRSTLGKYTQRQTKPKINVKNK